MERLLEAAGAEPIDWPLRTRRCGGSCHCGGPLIGALPEAAPRRSYRLLKDAKRRGAIATVCPLCQFDLGVFQGQMARRFGEPIDPHGRATTSSCARTQTRS
jgi:heterodisulfide reductase subunit B2